MTHVTFERMNPEESRILADGEYVGDVYRHDDILNPDRHFYVVHLEDDWRGPVRVHERQRIRDVTEERIRTHPLFP